jgi:ABC-type multidrug transport system ATPase subunit
VSSLSGSSAPSVVVDHVSVTYKTTFDRRPTLRGMIRSLGRGEKVVREVQAVKDVSFEIPHGTVLGIVGANGAGKSTLVRTIAGILPPTSGRIDVYGRVSTLLALGVGFNKNLSGRDNVRLGGLAAGLHREQLAEKYEDIVQVAELGEYPRLARARHGPRAVRPGDLDGPWRAAHVGRARGRGRRLHGVPRGGAGRRHARRRVMQSADA